MLIFLNYVYLCIWEKDFLDKLNILCKDNE